MNVRDVMTRSVVTCEAGEDLESVAWRMIEAGVSCVPVLDADRRPIGLLSHRDMARAAVIAERALAELGVGDALQPVVRHCWPDDSIEAAEAIMRAYRVRRLPVVDRAGAVVGLVTLGDIAAGVLREGNGSRARELLETQAEVPSLPRLPD